MNQQKWIRKKHERESFWSRRRPEGPFDFVLVLDHLKASHNLPRIIRSAHALGVREIHLVGIPPFDPLPAKGCFRKTRSRSFESFRESHDSLVAEGYTLYALDPRGEEALGQARLPEKCAFILGHEEFGMSFEPSEFPAVRRLRIPQFGEVESLNVSVAASLASYEYVRQMGFHPVRALRAEATDDEAPAPNPDPLPCST